MNFSMPRILLAVTIIAIYVFTMSMKWFDLEMVPGTGALKLWWDTDKMIVAKAIEVETTSFGAWLPRYIPILVIIGCFASEYDIRKILGAYLSLFTIVVLFWAAISSNVELRSGAYIHYALMFAVFLISMKIKSFSFAKE